MKKRGALANTVVKIVGFIANSPGGATINDIAKNFHISRNSVVIELARLEGAEKVQFRMVGNVKLYTVSGGKK